MRRQHPGRSVNALRQQWLSLWLTRDQLSGTKRAVFLILSAMRSCSRRGVGNKRVHRDVGFSQANKMNKRHNASERFVGSRVMALMLAHWDLFCTCILGVLNY